MLRRLVETSQGQLHVCEANPALSVGPPHGTFLLLPILPLSCWMWETAQSALADRGWRSVSVDLMGYGRSDKRRVAWRVEDFAENLVELMNSLNLNRVHVVAGHFAALPAVELAASHPDRVYSLVLDGPPVWPKDLRASLAQTAAGPKVAWNLKDDKGALIWSGLKAMLNKLAPDGLAENLSLDYALRRALVDFVEAAFEPTTLQAIAEYEILDRAPLIACPTLLVGGEHDEQSRSLALLTKTLPQGFSKMFDGLHPLHDLSHTERALEYISVVLDFAEQQLPRLGIYG